MSTAVVPAVTAVQAPHWAVPKSWPRYHQLSVWLLMVSVAVVSSMSLAVSVAAVSSFLIVPVAVASPSVAPVGFVNVTVKVSSSSRSSSAYTNTATSPPAMLFGAKVSVPDSAL